MYKHFAIFALVHTVLGQSDIGCFVPGECIDSTFLIALETDRVNKCLEECRRYIADNGATCQDFTFYVEEQVKKILRFNMGLALCLVSGLLALWQLWDVGHIRLFGLLVRKCPVWEPWVLLGRAKVCLSHWSSKYYPIEHYCSCQGTDVDNRIDLDSPQECADACAQVWKNLPSLFAEFLICMCPFMTDYQLRLGHLLWKYWLVRPDKWLRGLGQMWWLHNHQHQQHRMHWQ